MANPLFLTIGRDDVCAGDDCDGSHVRTIRVSSKPSVRAVVAAALPGRRLPSIAGGRAVWVAASKRPLVVAQQWFWPRYLVPFWTPRADCADPDADPSLHFHYLAQLDPHDVFLRLKAGESVRSLQGWE